MLISCNKKINPFDITEEHQLTALTNAPNPLSRTVVTNNKDQILEIINAESSEGKYVSLDLCINAEGTIVYAELLDDSTFEIQSENQKALLKSIFRNLKFEESDIEEECGAFKLQ